MVTISSLCQINGGCMGCCGHTFPSEQRVKESITSNTREYLKMAPSNKGELTNFRERRYATDLRDGVCRNLINTDGSVHCPLHPLLNKGADLRIGHCDVDFLCKTAKKFEGWDENKKNKFLAYVEKKKMTSIAYSMVMENDSLLMSFEESFEKVVSKSHLKERTQYGNNYHC